MMHLKSKHLLLCLLTLLQPFVGLHNLCAETKTRPTVAVVLSGGGARGVSHIPVLRAIEKAGIPVDIVVGTSMGALVGGLYAQGYSPDELDSITRSANWAEVMSDLDIQSRGDIRYRQFTSPFVLNIPFDRRLSEMLEGGIIKGRNVEGLINRLTLYPDSMSFDSLPIRYACVATDLASGKEIVFHNGKIAYAMRTSMAVPGIFAAVRQDSMVLVDGGLTNNFPVDVARGMGADVIIGVDLFSALKNSSELRTALDMVSQMLSMCIGDKEEENVADCDLYINTNTKGYSSTDFTTEKIDSLLLKGTQSAEKAWPRLTALHDSLFSDSATMANYVRPHSLCKELKAAMKEADENTEVSKLAPAQSLLSIGARLDTDEWAAVILGLTGRVREGKTRFPLWGEFVFRAGMRLHGIVKLNAGIARHAMVSFSYRTDRNNISLRRGQFNLITGTHVRGLAELNLTSCYRRTLLTAGVNFEHLHYRDVMLIGGLDGADVEAEKIIRYFLRFNFDNTDQRSTPTSGQRWIVEGQLASSNGIKYNGEPIVPILYGDWQMYISTPINLVVSPYIRGRLIFREVLDYAVSTTLVNTHRGGYSLGHSLAMAGIQKLEDVDRGVAIGGVELRQNIGKSFYAGLAANVAFNGDKPSHIFDETIWGMHALCGYKTVLGPIEAVVNWNTRERKKVGFLLSIGHKF